MTLVVQPAPSADALRVTLGFAADAAVIVNATVPPTLASVAGSRGGVAAPGVRRLLDGTASGTAGSNATVGRPPCAGCVNFTIPLSRIIASEEGWRHARMGLQVAWLDASGAFDKRRERLRHTDGRTPSAPFSASPLDWDTLNVDLLDPPASAPAPISFAVTQPLTGKLTVAIDSAAGTRVRNLISGRDYPAGVHSVEWDCTDDDGQFVSPGEYHWRAISHAGITPEYIMQFANGNEPTTAIKPFGSNHGTFVQATSNAQFAFLGAPLTEGGNSLIAVGSDGLLAAGYGLPTGMGYGAVGLAADETTLWRAHDGIGYGSAIDTSVPLWFGNMSVQLARYNIATGSRVDFAGRPNWCNVLPYIYGPGSPLPALANTTRVTLRGMALQRGLLYISALHLQALAVVNADTCTEVGRIPLPTAGLPGPVVASRLRSDILYVAVGPSIYTVQLPSATLPAPAISVLIPDASPSVEGLAVGQLDTLFVACASTHLVYVFTAAGGQVGTIGSLPSGPYEGPWDPERLVSPQGVAVLGNSTLWITESRGNPKRASRWAIHYDAASGAVTGTDRKLASWVADKPGNPPYGGPGAGMHPADPTVWVGIGALWRLNFTAGTATPTAVMQAQDGHLGGTVEFMLDYRIVQRDGRTFLIGQQKANVLSELMPDGRVKDLAFYGGAGSVLSGMKYQRTAFSDAFVRTHPGATLAGRFATKTFDSAALVLWVDRNGDGQMQEAEFEFGDHKKYRCGNYWGDRQLDLSLRIIVDVFNNVTGALLGQRVISLDPDGYLPGGAPNYPPLAAALDAGVPVTRLPRFSTGSSTVARSGLVVDRFRRVLVLTSPMVGIAATGRTEWRFPNEWSGVHGSHKAPMPETGVMQGTNFYIGCEPLDDVSDVTVLVGNHGRFFWITTDGLYLDECFDDIRVGRSGFAMMIGGEAFGGTFARASPEAGGGYWLQASGYRVYKIHGLDTTVRSNGTFAVSAPQILLAQTAVAERQRAAAAAAGDAVTDITIPYIRAGVAVSAGARDFSAAFAASWYSGNNKVKVGYNASHVFVHWYVVDTTPWVNTGLDWQTLFHSGDAVDVLLGMYPDPTAVASRVTPVVGDIRLLIAPLQGRPTAVLYRNRATKPASDMRPVEFASPWRAETVDDVRVLPGVQIAVAVKAGASYTVTAAIPLSDIFWPYPLPLAPDAGIPGVRRADFGCLYADSTGTTVGLRSYWANKATGLVSDVPGEVMMAPNLWGNIRFGAPPGGNVSIAFAGVLGNSGEAGDGLVTAGVLQAAWISMGPAVDGQGYLWDRNGGGRLIKYSLDGRAVASFPIAAGNGGKDRIVAVDGDLLVLALNLNYYALFANATPGSAPVKFAVSRGSGMMSGNAFRGRVLISTKAGNADNHTLWWLDPRSGNITLFTKLPVAHYSTLWEVDPSTGNVFVLSASGQAVTPNMLFAPNGTLLSTWSPGGPFMLRGGLWWSFYSHGTVYRFDAARQAAPGVVLGGNSGSVIGHMAENLEIDTPTGIAPLGGDLYALGATTGVMHIIRWDAAAVAMVPVRRIGSIYDTPELALDSAGRIFLRGATFFWEDGPDQPVRDSTAAAAATSQAVTLSDDTIMAACFPYGTHAFGYGNSMGILHGALGGALPVKYSAASFTDIGLSSARRYYGAANYMAPLLKRKVFLLLDDLNSAWALNPADITAAAFPVRMALNASLPSPYPFRSLAMLDGDTLVAAGNGTLVFFARNASDWAESSRFNGVSTIDATAVDAAAAGARFGGATEVAIDGGRIWVSDTVHHRVLMFDATKRTLLATFGVSRSAGADFSHLDRPTTLAARGDRAVVYDSGNRRVVKLTVLST
jgi:hypothetical protein